MPQVALSSLPPDLLLCIADKVTGSQGNGKNLQYPETFDPQNKALQTISRLSCTCKSLHQVLQPYLFEVDLRRPTGPEAAHHALRINSVSLMAKILDAFDGKLYPLGMRSEGSSDVGDDDGSGPRVLFVNRLYTGVIPGTERPEWSESPSRRNFELPLRTDTQYPKSFVDLHGRPVVPTKRLGSIECHRKEISAGEDRDPASYRRYTLLHVAVYHNQLDMISLLLDHGANVNQAGCLTCNCLPIIIGIDRGRVVEGIDLDDSRRRDEPAFCFTVLHTAICSGNTAAAKLLLRRGADVVLERSRSELFPDVRWLPHGTVMEENAGPDDSPETVVLGPYGIMEETALHFACYMGNLDLARFILKYDYQGNPDRPDTHGATPLHYSCENGMYDTVLPWLRLMGADINRLIGSAQEPILSFFCRIRRYEDCQRLLEFGASPKRRNKQGMDPLHVALSAPCRMAARPLAARSESDIEAMKDAMLEYTTPFDFNFLEHRPRVALVERLLELGVDLNVTTDDGRSPLVLATNSAACAQLVLLLARHGAALQPGNEGDENVMMTLCEKLADDHAEEVRSRPAHAAGLPPAYRHPYLHLRCASYAQLAGILLRDLGVLAMPRGLSGIQDAFCLLLKRTPLLPDKAPIGGRNPEAESIMRLLVAHGADPNAAAMSSNDNSGGVVETVRQQGAEGPSSDYLKRLFCFPKQRLVPRRHLISDDRSDLEALRIEYEAHPSPVDDIKNGTRFNDAIVAGSFQYAVELLDMGSPPGTGSTFPLHEALKIARKTPDERIMYWLFQLLNRLFCVCDANAADREGRTPLDIAVSCFLAKGEEIVLWHRENNFGHAINWLLEQGANPWLFVERCESPHHVTREDLNPPELVELFSKLCPDNAKEKYGY